MANEPRATNGSPVIKAKNSSKKIINYAKVIKTMNDEISDHLIFTDR